MANVKHTHNITDSTTPVGYKRNMIIIAIVGLGLIFMLWTWKTVQLNNLIVKHKQEQLLLKQRFSKQLESIHKHQLVLISKPMVWAIRNKMMEGNMNEVHLYIDQLAKEQNFEEIAIINPKGAIIASTDKKEEGHPYSTFYSKVFLNVDSTKVNTQRGHLILTTPIPGIDSRLGTLSFEYAMPGYNSL